MSWGECLFHHRVRAPFAAMLTTSRARGNFSQRFRLVGHVSPAPATLERHRRGRSFSPRDLGVSRHDAIHYRARAKTEPADYTVQTLGYSVHRTHEGCSTGSMIVVARLSNCHFCRS